MASSYSDYKEEIRDYIKGRYSEDSEILDVGAGNGTYKRLLGYPNMDAVEVYGPNADTIEGLYRAVYREDIRKYHYDWYDLVIFGDVLEHLEVEEAQEVLRYAYKHSKGVIVAVPYEYKQGIEYGNVYEIHKQDDLTPEIMKERYPELEEYIRNERYGYYVYNTVL